MMRYLEQGTIFSRQSSCDIIADSVQVELSPRLLESFNSIGSSVLACQETSVDSSTADVSGVHSYSASVSAGSRETRLKSAPAQPFNLQCTNVNLYLSCENKGQLYYYELCYIIFYSPRRQRYTQKNKKKS